MSKYEILDFLKQIKTGKRKELVIKIDRSQFQKNLNQAQDLLTNMERVMRIKRLEMSIKRMQISRSQL